MNSADGRVMELGPSSLEKQQIADASQGHVSLYASPPPGHQSWTLASGSAAVQWNSYRTDNGPVENGIPSISSYHDDQQTKNITSFQDGTNVASHTSSVPSMGASNAVSDYSAYFSNQNSTDPYAYVYQSQYYGYQPSSNDSSHQQVGAVQNTGAPYQPLSSFQNANPYVGPTSYSTTYYNPGDYQTTAGYQPAAAGYQSSDYNHQTSLWNDGNYVPHHYSTYTLSDANAGHCNSSMTVDPPHYQQQYSQWAGYYSQTASAVICAPGTEHVPHTSVAAEHPVPDFNGGYSMVSSQPPPPGTTSWRRDTTSSGLPSLQGTNDAAVYGQNSSWQNGSLVFANQQASQVHSHFQKPLDSSPVPRASVEDQHKTVYAHASNAQFPSINQVPQSFQPPSRPVSTLETFRVSKMQIPTNPRIATNLSIPKMDKESSTTDAVSKPAYINVPLSNPNNISSQDSAEGIMKGTFPLSLRAYVERSLARCKDDTQRLSNQNTMKEIITKASADGTLFTRDWDTEPLFPLPSSFDAGTKDSMHKLRRSPSRRTKSRWEPIAEEKMVEKPAIANHISFENANLNHFRGTEKLDVTKYENKVNGWSSTKFLSPQQTHANKNFQRPAKKQRFGDSDATENGDGSSGSDKEQGLTKYYSSAIALANSPEERKRREHRYKRFEKGQERQMELKNYQSKAFRGGGLYNRRTSVAFLSKYEDGSGQAVEDIDWDSFTVKGTCQEIEKRYLRLTSAPDPATVRPEEVLEKALMMVQSSLKNYLYKCDQLKSIRQDLTVQRIHNELTVEVYETHARLALEAGDMPEYNQCQSQLKGLYAEGIKGCHFEFAAYNLLCVILHSSNNRELLFSMARLSTEAKKDEAVKHALSVRAAVNSGNYITFFRLYKKAPNLSTCLMDLYVEKMRFEAVKCMSKSYRPMVPVIFIAQVLGFLRAAPTEENEGKDMDGLEDCEEWLKAHGAIISVDNNGEMQLDTKATSSSLYMPEPEDAVAHGDSNLAVDDFLARAS